MLPSGRQRLGVALGVLALGAIVLWQTTAIPISPIYAKVGPSVIPYAVAAGTLLLGLVLAVQAVTGHWAADGDADAEPAINWRAVGWLGAGLLVNVSLIGLLGFVVASTLLFACVARAFGSSRPGRDIAVGFAIAALTYYGFAGLLGINIGAGVFRDMF